MATYVISDIHGEHAMFCRLLEKIRFSGTDTLYVLGDTVDRGPHPMAVLQEMMRLPNVIPILGNHEWMAAPGLRFLMQEITASSVEAMEAHGMQALLGWQLNGGTETIQDFRRLPPEERQEVLAYLGECALFAEVETDDARYVLVHAGLEHFSPARPLTDYQPDELVWEPPDYARTYFPDAFLVTGHVPTQQIPGNPRPGFVYRSGRNLAVDCGACFGGRLAALCLETGAETYIP